MDNLDQSSLWCSCGPIIRLKKYRITQIERWFEKSISTYSQFAFSLLAIFISSIQRSQGHSIHDPVHHCELYFYQSCKLGVPSEKSISEIVAFFTFSPNVLYYFYQFHIGITEVFSRPHPNLLPK